MNPGFLFYNATSVDFKELVYLLKCESNGILEKLINLAGEVKKKTLRKYSLSTRVGRI